MPGRFTRAILAGLLLAPAVAAQDTGSRTISGEVTYLQRIALPPTAELHVAVSGRFGTTLGETRVQAGGQQVPLGFSLTLPRDLRGRLDAVIRIDDMPRWIVQDITLQAGSDAVDLGTIQVDPATPLAFLTELRCEDQDIALGILGEEMVLRVEGHDIALRETVSASGARYQGVKDPETVVWSKGEDVSIRLEGRDLSQCRLNLPPDRQPYRARGIEPGWHVDLGESTATVVADYGGITREAPRPAAKIMSGAYRFDMPEAEASLIVEETLCRNAATGMPYPDTATLTLGARVLVGCGGEPADLLTGDAWQVTALDGIKPEDPERVSINFLSSARVAGSTGCNRFVGGFMLTGEGLHFGAMGSTLMACPDTLMAQERRMLDAIEQVTRFDIAESGALQLIGGPEDKVLIEAKRP